MNQALFEQKIFNEALVVLNTKGALVVDTREGYDVFLDGKKAFGITVIGLYAVIYINGTVHSLPADKMATLYNRCREIYMAQDDQNLIKATKEIWRVNEQYAALHYLKQLKKVH